MKNLEINPEESQKRLPLPQINVHLPDIQLGGLCLIENETVNKEEH